MTGDTHEPDKTATSYGRIANEDARRTERELEHRPFDRQ